MTGKHGDRAGVSGVDGGDDALEHRGRGSARAASWTSTTSTSPQSASRPGRDGRLPARAAGDDRDEVAAVAGRGDRVRERVAFSAGGRDDDHLRVRAVEDAREGMPQHRVLVDADERLRDPRAQACARASRDDDDRDAGHRRGS